MVVLPKVPLGTYSVTVTPPADVAQAAVTTLSVDLLAGGVSQTVTLSSKVPLTGTLNPLPGAGQARLTAFDASLELGRSAPVATSADEGGGFALLVDPNRAYELVIDPLAGRGLARTVVVIDGVGPVGTHTGPLALTRGQAIKGTLVTGVGSVTNAFVQVFCEPSAASCVDPTQSLAEAVSRGDGSFDLVVPIPPRN